MDFISIIDDINKISPYQVMPDDDSGVCLYFQTDNGLTYIISFIKDEGFSDDFDNAYHMMFKEKSNQKGKYDSKVKRTISNIAMCFMKSMERVILFICDASDNREKMRSVLFNRWFNEFNQNGDYYKYDNRFDCDDYSVIFSFICSKNYPYITKCIEVVNKCFQS